ncbi:MAG: hypothetical protein HQ528_06060 [Candidatus Marinimicrobia bacterium]|nr:hypothetical protein [Candidatus Neomarinimicrobiota bacterium]
MRKLIPGTLVTLTFLLFGCAAPTGLAPVSGVEGQLLIPDSIFASGEVTAVALIVLDRLDLDHVADHFITYSDPILPCESNIQCDSLNYFFIQLPPGAYLLLPVGLLIPPEKLVTDLDSILVDPLPYIKLPGSTEQELLAAVKSVLIREKEIKALEYIWRIDL